MVNFQEWIFNKLPNRFRDEDTYKVDGKGLFQRFIEAHGHDLDTYVTPKIGQLVELHEVITVDQAYIAYIALFLGNPPDTFYDEEKYRKLLRYIMDINKVKGTLLSYELMFRILGVTVAITETPLEDLRYDTGERYDTGLRYDGGCPPCSGYTLTIYDYDNNMPILGTWSTDPLIEALLIAFISYLEPINARLTSITYTNSDLDTEPKRYNYWALFDVSLTKTSRFGALYNHPVLYDPKGLAKPGWRPANKDDWDGLIAYLGGTSNAGTKLKEVGTDYWQSAGGTNEVGFNLRANGRRSYVDGSFTHYMSAAYVWATNSEEVPNVVIASHNWAFVTIISSPSEHGAGVRLVKESTSLPEGGSSTYTQTDGLVIPTICINGVEWLAHNLCETKFNDGSFIPFAGANELNFTGTEWLETPVTPRMCHYLNRKNLSITFLYTGKDRIAPEGFKIPSVEEITPLVYSAYFPNWPMGHRSPDGSYGSLLAKSAMWLSGMIDDDDGLPRGMAITYDGQTEADSLGHGLFTRLIMIDPSEYTPGMKVTDYDGNEYDLVHITDGGLDIVITTTDLKTTKSVDGIPIPLIPGIPEWAAMESAAYSHLEEPLPE